MRGRIAGALVAGAAIVLTGGVAALALRDDPGGRPTATSQGTSDPKPRTIAPTRSAAFGSCTKLASSAGEDSAAGTPTAPFRTVMKLVASLHAGDVGCLASGETFSADTIRLATDGTATDPITITSAPGDRATLSGWLRVDGSHITVAGLILDGRNMQGDSASTVEGQPGLYILGNDVVVQDNEITNRHTAICVFVGGAQDEHVTGLVIDRNRIHACGVLPKAGLQHGIYLGHATGAEIADNVIYDISDYGVQVYPDSRGAVVRGNVIDQTGAGGIAIGSDKVATSSDTSVTGNIISRSQGPAIRTYWGGEVGTGNVASGNCEFGNAQATAAEVKGVEVTGTAIALVDPFTRTGSNPFRLRRGSPCVGYGPASVQP